MGSVTAATLDAKLVAYFESLASSVRKSLAEKLVASIRHFFPREAQQLAVSSRFLKQIKREGLTSNKPPMIFEVVAIVAMELIFMGFPATALAVVLQFDCYLRPAEVCGIQAGHVLFSGGSALGDLPPRALIVLPRTKTGFLQSVDVRMPILQVILGKICNICPSHQRLFPSYTTYLVRIQRALKVAGLSHVGYTPHSIRHGAATTDFLCFGYTHLSAILFRGRWESDAGKKYIQMGAALLLDAKLSVENIDQARVAKKLLPSLFRGASIIPGN